MIKVTDAEENISAISATFHQHAHYKVFYRKYAQKINGFTGIWSLCAAIGQVFTEVTKDVEWDGEWIECIDQVVDDFYHIALTTMRMETEGDLFNYETIKLIVQEVVRSTFERQHRTQHNQY